jgi:hypothetical protein
MLFEGGTLLLLPMGLIRMGDLTRVKSHTRYASSHRRALVQRALKLLDIVGADRMTYAQTAGRTALPVSTLRSWARRRERYTGWTPTNTQWERHLRIFSPDEGRALADFIQSQVLIPGHIFQDSDFRG